MTNTKNNHSLIKRISGISIMSARDEEEDHRAATPLELLFDLVSVIAIAAAAASLHHSIVEAHIADGIATFTVSFFCIWIAWINYTWFASAYDNDDTLFRLLTMVIMSGSLVMAAGISIFSHQGDLSAIVIGFIIMRLAMVCLWLRAAKHDPERKQTAIWYASGIALAQVYWVILLLNQPLPSHIFYALFVLGALLELAIPALAENKGNTPWHRHHIIERFGLLNIIVLGETLLAGSLALSKAFGEHFDIHLISLAISSLIILFSMWWLYFSKEDHIQEKKSSLAFTWGYGHLVIYMSGAAVGAGVAALVDITTHHSAVSVQVGTYAIAIPLALYLMGLWFVRDRFVLAGTGKAILPIFATLALITPLLFSVECIAVVALICVLVRSQFACQKQHKAIENL